MPTTIDFSALSDPLPEAEVQAWKAKAKAAGNSWAMWNPSQILGAFLLVRVVLGLVGLFIVFSVVATGTSSEGRNTIATFLPLVIGFGLLAVVAIAVVKGFSSFGLRWELWARMDRFARANGMTFTPIDPNPNYPGAIFSIGDTRLAVDHLVSTSGRFFDIGNYRYSTGSGKSRSTRTWGFLAFNLDRKMPNMVLDSKANNGWFGTNLPATFDKKQILHLEGDFDKHFTLYCPKEYERDALYVFTPDLMALLIDEAAPFDVEIVDDWMFVYSQTPLPTGNPGTYARLFRIIDTVGAKTLTQTDRYVDERVGDFTANVVAPQGARLKRRVSVGAIVFGLIFAAVWLWGAFGDSITR
jgi:nitrate reductase NapE component